MSVVPLDRRVLYALATLTGARSGELSALQWHHFNPNAKPIASLTFERAWSTRKKDFRRTKTNVVKEVPVHPSLFVVLSGWWVWGWQTTYLREPKPVDLIVPTYDFRPRNADAINDALQRDLKAVGQRPRTFRSFRRGFKTNLERMGAKPDVVERMQRKRPSEVGSRYREVWYVEMCEEIVKLPFRVDEDHWLTPPLRVSIGAA